MKLSTFLLLTTLALVSNAASWTSCSPRAQLCVKESYVAVQFCETTLTAWTKSSSAASATESEIKARADDGIECACDEMAKVLKTCVPMCTNVIPLMISELEELKELSCPALVIPSVESFSSSGGSSSSGSSNGNDQITTGASSGALGERGVSFFKTMAMTTVITAAVFYM
jgi:hypothetical protein